MKSIKLDSSEIENIEECIPYIEKMYKFKFGNSELETIRNFEEFCDLIIEKVNLENDESCTSQQAFYKLRKSLETTKIFEKEKLNPQMELKNLFPRKNRKTLIQTIENEMGFKFDIIQAPDFVTIPLLLIGVVSFFYLFFDWKVAFIGISISIFGSYCCKWFGNELNTKTVKDLVKKITEENYVEVRTNKSTVNKPELKMILTNWISENSGISKEKLKHAAFSE